MHFRIENYSLSKDVVKAQKHPHGGGKEYLTPPLLVMNHFSSPSSTEDARSAAPKQLESLVTEIFRNLIPPISPHTTPLSSIRRVLLLNREIAISKNTCSIDTSQSSISEGTFILNLRHFAITTKRTGLSRRVCRLDAAEKLIKQRTKTKRGLPNLGELEDVADYLLDPAAATATNGGFTSGSESEVETDAEVEVLERNARKVLNRRQMALLKNKYGEDKQQVRCQFGVEKRAVKLVELGPRMKLRLTKLEEGMCEGKILWHEFIEKSSEEMEVMETIWKQRREEKEQRKKMQKENVERKRKERAVVPNGAKGEENDKDEGETTDENEWDSEGLEVDGES